VSVDIPLQKLVIPRRSRRKSLKLSKPEEAKLIIALDLRETRIDKSWILGESILRESEGRKGDKYQPLVKRHRLISQDQRSHLIAGTESDRVLKILERAAIETTVLPKGYVETGGELRGEKQYGLKPLLATPKSCSYVRT